jgi:hypothetical protein
MNETRKCQSLIFLIASPLFRIFCSSGGSVYNQLDFVFLLSGNLMTVYCLAPYVLVMIWSSLSFQHSNLFLSCFVILRSYRQRNQVSMIEMTMMSSLHLFVSLSLCPRFIRVVFRNVMMLILLCALCALGAQIQIHTLGNIVSWRAYPVYLTQTFSSLSVLDDTRTFVVVLLMLLSLH